MNKLPFSSDYMTGAHPRLLERLVETNTEACAGYGTDPLTEEARDRIRAACHAPESEVFFLSGGTQANAIVISSLLRPWQAVVAADTGHIGVHEAGAIEHGGHKVLTVPHVNGKLVPDRLENFLRGFLADENHDHMAAPGMVYISQPTEYGTIYSLDELRSLRRICTEYGLYFYADGARLAYALAAGGNDVTLPDMAELFDVFYIGGTKCGALLGEAVVIPRPGTIPHFFTMIKQQGALLAKGRVMGVQFSALFTDGLYEEIGAQAVRAADEIRCTLDRYGYTQYIASPTNQIFVVMENNALRRFGEKVSYGFWERPDETHTVIRLATCWSTTEEEVQDLCRLLSDPAFTPVK